MKNRSIYLLFDEPKKTSEVMLAFSYSLSGLISSPVYLNLILEFEYCSGGDLVISEISRSGTRERSFNIRYVLPEKNGPTKSVLLLLFGFSNTLELDSFWGRLQCMLLVKPACSLSI